jgi:hypothetical protein
MIMTNFGYSVVSITQISMGIKIKLTYAFFEFIPQAQHKNTKRSEKKMSVIETAVLEKTII